SSSPCSQPSSIYDPPVRRPLSMRQQLGFAILLLTLGSGTLVGGVSYLTAARLVARETLQRVNVIADARGDEVEATLHRQSDRNRVFLQSVLRVCAEDRACIGRELEEHILTEAAVGVQLTLDDRAPIDDRGSAAGGGGSGASEDDRTRVR